MSYNVNEKGYYGQFGGAYIPEMLYPNVEELRQSYIEIADDPEFKKEFDYLLKHYVGRPSPLYYAKRLSSKYGAKIYLKREDLNHTGAHKINNTIGTVINPEKETALVIALSSIKIALSDGINNWVAINRKAEKNITVNIFTTKSLKLEFFNTG